MNDEDLRDFFAGLALTGLSSRGVYENSEPSVATWCYKIADAMLEAKYAQAEVGIKAAKPRRKKADV